MIIKPAEPLHNTPIHRLLEAAFGRPQEARLVEALRRSGYLALSLVALEGQEVIGYAAWSPVSVDGVEARLVGLGPIAVDRSHRCRAYRTPSGGEGLAATYKCT